MDHFKRTKRQISGFTFVFAAVMSLLPLVAYYLIDNLTTLSSYTGFLIGLGVAFVITLLLTEVITRHALKPLFAVWQAVLHVSPGPSTGEAPNLEKLKVGRELVTSLVNQVYQFASQQDNTELMEHRKQLNQASNIVHYLPLPLFVFNKHQIVTNASQSALQYGQIESAELFGKPLFESLDLEFQTEDTLETWIKQCEGNKITDISYWERVRVKLPGNNEYKQCDLVASYNKDNPSGTEFVVMLYDRTKRYSQDDSALDFIAMAVHELRTPLTMLRGYIEIFESELGPTLNPEMKDFLTRMSFSATQLTSFVNNVLNIGRIQENELVLKLHEDKWDVVLAEAIAVIEPRAKANLKTISMNIAPNLPTVAIDRVSITEVISNLLDNAIKYSGRQEKPINITVKEENGMVVTTVQDFGMGIPQSVLPNLFERFYRNHRTKGEVGGTGLGLFLSKSMINAHGGQIWVESKEGEGSTFGFSLLPYAKLADEQKNSNNEIVRTAHGWIKNHSLYRR